MLLSSRKFLITYLLIPYFPKIKGLISTASLFGKVIYINIIEEKVK